MPYITSVERRGIQKGLEQGLQQGLRDAQDMVVEAVAARFGTVSDEMAASIRGVQERETLRALLRQAITCPTLAAFQEVLRAQA